MGPILRPSDLVSFPVTRLQLCLWLLAGHRAESQGGKAAQEGRARGTSVASQSQPGMLTLNRTKQDLGESGHLRRVLLPLQGPVCEDSDLGLLSLQFQRVTRRVIPTQVAGCPWNHFRGMVKMICQAPSQIGVRGHTDLRKCEQSPQGSEREAGEACRDC